MPRNFTITLGDFAHDYRRKKLGSLTRKQYKELAREMQKHIEEEIVTKQQIFTWPNGLGILFIKTFKSNLFGRRNVKFRMNKETKHRERLKYTNASTFGFFYKHWWTKSRRRMKNKNFYNFIPVAGRCSGRGKYFLTRFLEAHNIDREILLIDK